MKLFNHIIGWPLSFSGKLFHKSPLPNFIFMECKYYSDFISICNESQMSSFSWNLCWTHNKLHIAWVYLYSCSCALNILSLQFECYDQTDFDLVCHVWISSHNVYYPFRVRPRLPLHYCHISAVQWITMDLGRTSMCKSHLGVIYVYFVNLCSINISGISNWVLASFPRYFSCQPLWPV